jgi:hypothetical protein
MDNQTHCPTPNPYPFHSGVLMAYSRNPKTLESRLHLVEFLGDLEPVCEWSCEPHEEIKLAQQIREALWIAANICPEKYPGLARAYGYYTFKTAPGKVVALKAEAPRKPEVKRYPAGTPTIITEEDDAKLQTLLGDDAPYTQKGPVSLIQIVQSIKTHGKGGLPYHFPDAGLSKPDIRSLCKWIGNQPDYLLFWADPAITVKAYSDDLAPFATTMEDIE